MYLQNAPDAESPLSKAWLRVVDNDFANPVKTASKATPRRSSVTVLPNTLRQVFVLD